jgi:formate dehydrogenase (coenzyme F420) beta subunit
MNTQWIVDTHGDPLGTVRDLAMAIWGAYDLGAMVAPMNGNPDSTGPRAITDIRDVKSLNPFAPLMPINAAKLVPQLIKNSSTKNVAAVLRPCEMRTLIEMSKQDGLHIDDLLTISVDCLGTLPLDEYQWRVERKGSPKGLTQEALQFSRQGGILRYRYRSACQVCLSPEATVADINIGILGLPVRQHLIVNTKDNSIAEKLNLTTLAASEAHQALLASHQRVTARLVQRSENTQERIAHGLAELLPKNVAALIDQFESCGDCTACLDTCPLCDMHYPRHDKDGKFAEDEIMRWLISCSGCGVCEQACPQHLPLTIIFNHIRMQLAEEFNYQAGFSLEDSLPVL